MLQCRAQCDEGGGIAGPDGGVDGDRAVERLPEPVRSRLTLENDDKVYTPSDLLPVCNDTGVPLGYNVHHHRSLPDGLGIDDTIERAWATWNREPLFHISSPLEGWRQPKPARHHDYIDLCDVPDAWKQRTLKVEVGAGGSFDLTLLSAKPNAFTGGPNAKRFVENLRGRLMLKRIRVCRYRGCRERRTGRVQPGVDSR